MWCQDGKQLPSILPVPEAMAGTMQQVGGDYNGVHGRLKHGSPLPFRTKSNVWRLTQGSGREGGQDLRAVNRGAFEGRRLALLFWKWKRRQ